jgi:hypothetical protein
MHPAVREIKARHFSHDHVQIRTRPEDRADGLRDIDGRQSRGRHLIEQWLEEMVILPVNDGDPSQMGRKALRERQPSESGAHHNDVRQGGINETSHKAIGRLGLEALPSDPRHIFLFFRHD